MSERPGFDFGVAMGWLAPRPQSETLNLLQQAYDAGREAGRASRVPPDSEAVAVLKWIRNDLCYKAPEQRIGEICESYVDRIDACLAGEEVKEREGGGNEGASGVSASKPPDAVPDAGSGSTSPKPAAPAALAGAQRTPEGSRLREAEDR